MSTRKNISQNKAAALLTKYINESGEDFTANVRGNVNWATPEEVSSLKRPNQQDYFDAIKDRQTSPISDETIVIEENQKALNLVFRNGLNIRDMGNPMFGYEGRTNRKNLGSNITLADAKDNKVCVIYGGDLLGEEWELKRLNNAKIIEQDVYGSSLQEMKSVSEFVLNDNEKPQENDVVHIRKALFFALGERVKVLKRDISYVLRYPNVEIYLLNGAQEQKINQYFKIDVLGTIVSNLKNPRIHYIRGINTIINVEKKRENGESTFGTIGLLTNNSLSKASKGQAAKNAVRMNSGENIADVVFVTNTNVAGKKGPKDYYVSGESTFVETAQKKNPAERPRGYNTFSLRMPANREFTVIEGMAPDVDPLEMIVYKEYVKNRILKEDIIRRVEESLSRYDLPHDSDLVKRARLYAAQSVTKPDSINNGGEEDEKTMSDM